MPYFSLLKFEAIQKHDLDLALFFHKSEDNEKTSSCGREAKSMYYDCELCFIHVSSYEGVLARHRLLLTCSINWVMFLLPCIFYIYISAQYV